jgi:superfamily II DNA/RNA helicase
LITQRLVATSADPADKRHSLREIIRAAPDFKNAIIFCNRKREVAVLHRSLQRHGFNAAALHGDLDQRARMAALDSFRTGAVALLVASDVAARGLDIPAVSHVFNYDIPHHAEDYVHRIGRTGRAGRSGHAYTLVAPGDEKSLAAIESLIGQPVPWEGPSVADAGGAGERPRREESSRRGGRSRASAPREREDRKPAGEARPARESRPAREPRPPREAAPPREPRPAREARPPREARPSRDARAERGSSSGTDVRAREPRPTPARGGDDDRVLGLGDHVPAFLARPVQKKVDQ